MQIPFLRFRYVNSTCRGYERISRRYWAEASTIMRSHGDDTPRWVAERIAALALVDEYEGVERFVEIADR